MARKTKERAIQSPGITIIGEGLTERYYFTHLKRLKGYRYTCKPRNFTEQSIEDIQKQVERVLADRGVAVCVFDADVARAKPAEKAKLDAMRKKYANRENVVICDSMPSIEFWFLIHFLNTNKYFASSRDVVQVLRRHISNFDKHDSFLSKEKWVAELLVDNRLETAMQRAESFGTNGESHSNIYKAFKRFEQKE